MKELKNLDESPRTRTGEPCLLEKHLAETDEHYQKGDYIQAGEEALEGYHGSRRAFYAALGRHTSLVIQWGQGKMDKFIGNNVSGNLRDKFYRLIYTAPGSTRTFMRQHVARSVSLPL